MEMCVKRIRLRYAAVNILLSILKICVDMK